MKFSFKKAISISILNCLVVIATYVLFGTVYRFIFPPSGANVLDGLGAIVLFIKILPIIFLSSSAYLARRQLVGLRLKYFIFFVIFPIMVYGLVRSLDFLLILYSRSK